MARRIAEKHWATIRPTGDPCVDTATWRQRFGTHWVDGVEYCCSCGGRVDNAAAEAHHEARREAQAAALSESRVLNDFITTLSEVPGHKTIRCLGLVTRLDSAAGLTAGDKGRDALADAENKFAAAARAMGANAIVGVQVSTFGARGGVTSVVGGDAVGVVFAGTAVVVEPIAPSPAQESH